MNSKIFILTISVLLLIKCNDGNNHAVFLESTAENIISKISMSNSLSEFLKPVRIIKISSESKDGLFGKIDDIGIWQNGFVIMDSYVSRKVLHFNNNGLFNCMIGRHGDGPGEYRQPICIHINSKGELIILNNNPCDFHIYSKPSEFKNTITSRRFKGFFDPYRIKSIDSLMVCFVIGRGNDRVHLLNEKFEILNSFLPDEPQQKIVMYRAGDLCVVDDKYIWIAGAFDPRILILDKNGNVIKTTGLQYLSRDNILKPSDISHEKYDAIREKSSIKSIININNKIIIIGPFIFNGILHYDIYNTNGDVIKEMMPLGEKWQRPIGSLDSFLCCCDMDGPEIDEKTNAILTLYKLDI